MTSCHYCNNTLPDPELRPYGPGGAMVCHQCVMESPERQAVAENIFKEKLETAGPLAVLGVGNKGPVSGIDLLQENLQAKDLLIKATKAMLETQTAKVEELTNLVGELYQVLGSLDAPVKVLDQVSAAMCHEQLPHKTLLPFVEDDLRRVPFNPTEDQWGSLARDIIMGWDMGAKTAGDLLKHLSRSGKEIPQWLQDEPEMKNLDHVPSKGTRVTLIYKAMLGDFKHD